MGFPSTLTAVILTECTSSPPFIRADRASESSGGPRRGSHRKGCPQALRRAYFPGFTPPQTEDARRRWHHLWHTLSPLPNRVCTSTARIDRCAAARRPLVPLPDNQSQRTPHPSLSLSHRRTPRRSAGSWLSASCPPSSTAPPSACSSCSRTPCPRSSRGAVPARGIRAEGDAPLVSCVCFVQ